MADKRKGFIPLYRSLQEHWIWQDDAPFDARSAWIDLILSVNHKEEKRKIKNKVLTIKPGQMPISYRFLAQRWRWSINRVSRFLKLLQSDGMIYLDKTQTNTLITLVNYRVYALFDRGVRNTNEYTNEYTDEHTSEYTGEYTDGYKDNNVNNINNVKHEKNTPLTPQGESARRTREWQ